MKIRLLRRSKCLFLPDTPEARAKVTKILGLEVPEFPKVCWNRVTDFRTAYGQSVLFLVVMNWFDGLVIDGLWVRRSKIWRIAGMEGIPYAKPWNTILVRRSLGTVVYLVLALAIAGIVVLLGRIFF